MSRKAASTKRASSSTVVSESAREKRGARTEASPKTESSLAARRKAHAPVFAALGDETRLWLVAKLARGAPQSISELAAGSKLSRQAITKHLRVLESAGVVHSTRSGRESRFEFEPEPIQQIKDYLALVSEQWDEVLGRLKSFVEE